MASLSVSEFEVVHTNLNVELIIPILKDLGLLSSPDIEKLANKSQKQAVKIILKKAKQHLEGYKIFHSALEKTKTDEGHQKILQNLGLQLQAIDLEERSPSNNGSHTDFDQTSNLAKTPGTLSKESCEILSSSLDKSSSLKWNVRVHFIYDELEFPKRLQAGNFAEFYTKVYSALSSKKSASKPCHLQYQFGAKWYDFNEDTGFDGLCMDEHNPEVCIKAISTPVDSPLSDLNKTKLASPSFSVGMSNSGKTSTEFMPSDQTKQQCVSTVEDDKDIKEKYFLKGLIDSAMGYLQRSLAIMIKSFMSKLFGTKETLQKLHEITLELNRLKDNSTHKKVGLIARHNEMVDNSCKFWKSDCVETDDAGPDKWVWHDWVWHSRQMLPRKKDPQEEWKRLTEDLKSWQLDTCLKLIKRATHNEKDLFTSEYLCFKSSQEKYNIRTLADSATDVRNFYAHPHSYTEVKERYVHDFLIVEEFATELHRWFKNEVGNSKDIASCLGDLQLIQEKRKEYLNHHTVECEKVLNGLKNLNFNELGYILVSTPCNSRMGVAVSKEELAKLSNIPWDTIIDFDITSREDGLWHALCESKGAKGQYRFLNNNIVVPFSYTDLDGAERRELCRDGRIPWIFPHGEVHNKTNEACHFKNHDLYCKQIRKPLITAMRKITTYIVQNKTQGAVGVILCYGNFACQSEKLPYENYFSDLKYLCEDLKHSGSHVIILSDNIHLADILKPYPVFTFPLDAFCKMIHDKLHELHIGQNNLPSIKMPGLIGKERTLRVIKTIDEEDFELVHKDIAEHEMHKLLAQEKINLQQQNKTVSDDILKSDIKYKLREKLYKGDRVTWISLSADHTITRREEENIIKSIREKLEHAQGKLETTKYVIYHSKGAGATTLARKILWNLKVYFPCVILKPNYKHSEAKAKCTSQALKSLYEDLQYPILMLVDEEPSFRTIYHLRSYLQELHTPVVFLQVQRSYSSAQREVKDSKESFVLRSTLHRDDADKLIEKFLVAFGKDKISAGNRKLRKLESSLVPPKVGDQVTDLDLVYSGTITGVTYKQEGMCAYHLVMVSWQNKENNEVETCRIGSFASKSDIKYKAVYLKTEVTKSLYESFHFYGIMYLDEDFRESMSEHVQECLKGMVPDKEVLDDLLKEKFLILAYLSILFAFKVCESIHIKAFEHLCYAVTKSSRSSDKFNIKPFIPEAALEFTITTLEGRFCIIHPIVAEEIIKFYCSIPPRTVNPSPDFYCNFLKNMLPESENPNEEVLSAINRLLKYREYIGDGQGYFTRKPFSELIIKLQEQNPQHAIDVLEYASSEISHLQTCHTYAHFARFISKSIKDFERALDVLEQARLLATKSSERGLVLNIKGDIYREWLENYLKQHKTVDWKEIQSEVCNLHFYSCQAYQDAHRTNHEDIPLFNELTVRLNLLEAIKKRHKVNKHQKFLNFIYQLPNPEVAGSVDDCRQLIKNLSEMIYEGQSFDTHRDEAHLKSLESRLLDIIGASEKEQKEILRFLMKRPTYVNVLHIRRSYIHLCHPDCCTSPTDLDFCLQLLEENFKLVGHVDRDMKNWLLIIKNMPLIGGNLKVVEEKLLEWKNQGPCITEDKQTIQVKNNPLWVNFYLTICYFMQLIEFDKTAPLLELFKNACDVLQEESKENKSRFQIKEWLRDSGIGFGQLQSGRYISDEMLQLPGSVGIPSWQEARHIRGDKGFPYILWKSIKIPFDAKRYTDQQLKQGNQVTFGVGFTLRGPQAIVFIKSDSSKPNSPRKTMPVNGEGQQQPVQATMSSTLTYSQAVSSSKTPTPEHKLDQREPSKKKKTRKKKK